MASAAVLAGGLGGAAQAVTAPTDGPTVVAGSTTYRLAGPDRYATAVKVSQQWYATSKAERPRTVYLASGENFPDALSAAPIAGLNRAPLLLTNTAKLPDIVAAELQRLKPKKVVIVGGPTAVSDAVLNKVGALGFKAVRVAGPDRFATSRAVIRYGMITAPDFATVTKNADGTYTTALTAGFLGADTSGKPLDVTAALPQLRFYMATGMNFPDALSIGAIGGNWLGAYPGPVFLEYGTGSSISNETVKLMEEILKVWGPTSIALDGYIIGSDDVMSAALMQSAKQGITQAATAAAKPVGKIIRIGGTDRYETSRMIVDKLKKVYTAQDPGNLFPDPKQGVFAVGDKFPDALAGSAYAAASNSAMWIIPPSCVPAGVFVTANKLKLKTYALLGDKNGALLAPVDTLTMCP